MTARMSHRRTTSIAVLLVLGLPLAAGPAVAAGKDVTYRAALNGGSEVGLRSAAGWNSGAMVARYAAMAATELAQTEHQRIFG